MAELSLEFDEPLIPKEAFEDGIEKIRDAMIDEENGSLKQVSWPLVKSSVADALSQATATDKAYWLFRGWSLARELKAYKDREKYPPDQTNLLKLGEHDLSGTLKPVVTISLEGAPLAKLEFEVKVKGALDAVSLKIRDGQIIGFGGGDCKLTMSCKFRDVDLTGPVGLAKMKLAPSFEFAEPIVIP
ncbi:MAG: hypothetical protein AAF583_00640 [Pseudomonadota bacterium]